MSDDRVEEPEDQEEATDVGLAGLPLAPRTRHLFALEFGDRKDFDDPRQSAKRPGQIAALDHGCRTPRERPRR
jgi:hypothetical protein